MRQNFVLFYTMPCILHFGCSVLKATPLPVTSNCRMKHVCSMLGSFKEIKHLSFSTFPYSSLNYYVHLFCKKTIFSALKTKEENYGNMFVLYSPLIMALIVNKTKLVGTTTVASNDCIALLRNLKVNKT